MQTELIADCADVDMGKTEVVECVGIAYMS